MTEKAPQTTSDDPLRRMALLELRFRLAEGVGPKTRAALLARFETLERVFNASPSQLREVEGVGPKLVRALCHPDLAARAEQEWNDCQQHNVSLLLQREASYPQLLREIHAPPGVLYCRGEVREQDAFAIAIVGSRHASHYGISQAEQLAGALARAGLTIVSGLARGIDAAAHRGAIRAGGRTLAVLGSGLLELYPPEHVDLAEEVAQSGAMLSEFSLRTVPMAGTFPQRNRVISGLALGVIVVEASERSGSLITARHAMEQGREVLAVPGRVDNPNSRGCHRLIRDGARLVMSVDDVLEQLGPLPKRAEHPKAPEVPTHSPQALLLNELEQKVLAAVGAESTPVDAILENCGLEGQQVLATLTVLEMKRLVRRVGGWAYFRC